jgi:hypothetical protein
MAAITNGKRTVPYMMDENEKNNMFESDDIIEYLFEKCLIFIFIIVLFIYFIFL